MFPFTHDKRNTESNTNYRTSPKRYITNHCPWNGKLHGKREGYSSLPLPHHGSPLWFYFPSLHSHP